MYAHRAVAHAWRRRMARCCMPRMNTAGTPPLPRATRAPDIARSAFASGSAAVTVPAHCSASCCCCALFSYLATTTWHAFTIYISVTHVAAQILARFCFLLLRTRVSRSGVSRVRTGARARFALYVCAPPACAARSTPLIVGGTHGLRGSNG